MDEEVPRKEDSHPEKKFQVSSIHRMGWHRLEKSEDTTLYTGKGLKGSVVATSWGCGRHLDRFFDTTVKPSSSSTEAPDGLFWVAVAAAGAGCSTRPATLRRERREVLALPLPRADASCRRSV